MFLSFFKTSEKVTCLMGCNRCLDPIEGLKTTHREAQTHTHKPNLLVSPGNTLYPAVAQNHPTCKNFDLAFTKLQPIVSWYAIDIKTNGPISVKCLMTDRCVGFGGVRVVRHMWWPLISHSEMKGLICGCSVDREPHLQLREETGWFAPAKLKKSTLPHNHYPNLTMTDKCTQAYNQHPGCFSIMVALP